MVTNTNNYSLHKVNSTYSSVHASNIALASVISGCNQIIKGYRDKYLFIYIPKKYVDNVINSINEKVTKKITLSDILDEYKKMGFTYIVDNFTTEEKRDFLGKSYNEWYCFTIEHNNCSKTRYYAFCMIRHFYYFQNYIIEYFTNILNEDYDEYKKILLLGILNRKFNVSYTYIQQVNTYENDTFEKTLNYFLKKGMNAGTGINLKIAMEIPYLELYEQVYYINNLIKDNETIVINKKDIPVLNKIIDTFKLKEYITFSDITIQKCGHYKYYEVLNIKNVLNINNIFNNVYNNIDEVNVHINVNNATCSTNKSFKILNMTKILRNIKKNSFVQIRSRHPSHDVFRKKIISKNSCVIRLGSTTELKKDFDIEINSIESIKNSSNKRRMKMCFDEHEVKTAKWRNLNDDLSELKYPLVVKNIFGSRNTGNYKVDTEDQLSALIDVLSKKELKNYIVEEYKNYLKEYRIHVSTDGVFLAWRKMRNFDTPSSEKWYFNNSNCVWIGEQNPNFEKPFNWDEICNEARKALNAVGLDIGGVDMRVMSNYREDGKKKKNIDFCVIEINSACSQASITESHYTEEFIKLIKKKSECVD
jgi:hypothetical protein